MNGSGEMRIYDERNRRLYISPEERVRFITAASRARPDVHSLCLTLLYTGCRLSEALALKSSSILADAGLISIRCLKKRSKHVIREVPIPPQLTELLDVVHNVNAAQVKGLEQFLWSKDDGSKPLHRTTAWRWIKEVMDVAEIKGLQATAKGLRHGYGIHAIRSGVQLHILKKWMGHSDMATTAIYATTIGKEEQELAKRMW